MLESFDGRSPKVAKTAFVHPAAHVRGDVEIGEYSIVWPGTTITGDLGAIKIGRCVIIEDNCVLHAGSIMDWKNNKRSILEIGSNSAIGHGAVVHARKIGDRVLIGMNATVLERVVIGNKCVIAAGALVLEGMEIPDKSMVAGVPGRVKENPKGGYRAWVEDGLEQDDSYYIEYIRKFREATTIE